MKILLVRHGQTEGNKVHRFIGGRTDEPVSESGKEELKKRKYPRPEHVFSSPMLRCVETSGLVFDQWQPEILEGFRECDFGILEGKTHEELLGNPRYDAFIRTPDAGTFPGGEEIEAFNRRSFEALKEAVKRGRKAGASFIGCTVHGGTIMAVMSALFPEEEYYHWNVANGEGYLLEIDEEEWEQGRYAGTLADGADDRIYT